jgi:hypothetical protein
MQDKNKNGNRQQDEKRHTDLSKKNPAREAEDQQGNNRSGSINTGNPANIAGKTKSNRELHTKSTVTGSDSDGQTD